MEDISKITIDLLQEMHDQSQHGVRLTIALKNFLDGTNKLSINTRTVDRFQELLETGKFTTNAGLEFQLPDGAYKILFFNPNDVLVRYTLNACINKFVLNDSNYKIRTVDLDPLIIKQYREAHLGSLITESEENKLVTGSDIRQHFWQNYFYKYEKYKDFFNEQYLWDKINPPDIACIVRDNLVQRLSNWIKIKATPGSTTNAAADEKKLIELEKTFLSEEYGIAAEQNATSVEESASLLQFINNVFNKSSTENQANKVNKEFDDILKKAFSAENVVQVGSTEKQFFLSVFKGSDIEKAAKLSEATFKALVNKLEISGLLKLASYAGSIEEFARRRLSSTSQLRLSAMRSIDPVRDTAWLSELNNVVQNISRDPVTLGILNVYFPSLVTFFFDSIAAASDYSNQGKGGGQEDQINSLEDFMNSLEKAFGRTVDFKRK